MLKENGMLSLYLLRTLPIFQVARVVALECATIALMLFAALPPVEASQKQPLFHVFMYKHDAAGCPLTTFFPSDKIVIQTNFQLLKEGQYTFSVEWYNPKGELQEVTKHAFYHPQTAPYAIWSKLQLHPSGTLERLLSTTQEDGYGPELFGTWRVKVYLNDKELTTKEFQIRS
jgi:hypothetical protein